MYGYDVFHEELLETLIKSVREDRGAHSYIFEGADGMGKHMAAKLLAAAFLCEEKLSPCTSCKSCVMAKAGTHPDIKHITPAEDKKNIGVDVIRDLNSDAYIKPFYSEKKIYIIEGDLLTKEAQNAFLKTLEEPPLYAVFIIVTSDTSKLLQTVISRCSHIKFPPVTKERLRKFIDTKYPGMSDGFEFHLSYSGGNPAKLERLVESPEFSILRDECSKAVSGILSNEYNDCFEVSDFFDTSAENILDVLDIMMLFLRDILLLKEGEKKLLLNSDYEEKLRAVSSGVTEEKVMLAMELIPLCAQMKQRNVGAKYIGMYLALQVKTRSETFGGIS